MTTRNTTTILALAWCVLAAQAWAEEATAKLTLEDKNDKTMRGFAQFADPNATLDNLYVEKKTSDPNDVVKPKGVKVRQGHKNSIIFILAGTKSPEDPNKYHVAYIVKREGKSLYEVYGEFSFRGWGPNVPQPEVKDWQADYSSGNGADRRIIAFVNDSVDINVAKTEAFTNDDYLTVKLTGWTWQDANNATEKYTVTLTDANTDPDDTGQVEFFSSNQTMGWISTDEFCDIRYVRIRGRVDGLTKIKATASPALPTAYAPAYIGDIEIIDGYRFLTIGSNKACIVTNPAAEETTLGYKYLYFPAECSLNNEESTNCAVIKVASGIPVESDPDEEDPQDPEPLVGVYLDNGTTLTRCMPVSRAARDKWDMFSHAYGDWNWTGCIAAINAYEGKFGGNGSVTQTSIRSSIVAAIHDANGIDANQYWLSPPITAASTTPMKFVLAVRYGRPANEGNGGTHPTQVNATNPDPMNSKGEDQVRTPAIAATTTAEARLPLSVTQVAPTSDDGVKQYEKYEAVITLDPQYFCQERGTTGRGLPYGERFNAYDCDGLGNRIQVDATFKSGATTCKVPCFPFKGSLSGDWTWRVRFAPPTEGVWALSARAVTWHKSLSHNDCYDDRQNTVPGHDYSMYHYWGYNDTVDPLYTGTGTANYHNESTSKFKVEDANLPIPLCRFKAVADTTALQPLTAPESGQSPFYFRSGDTPVFLSGVSWSYSTANYGTRIQSLKDNGLNFNSLWFAPWDTMLAHESSDANGTEVWFSGLSNANTISKLPETEKGWTAYKYFDQGRAKHMDDMIKAHLDANMYVSLTIWPHPSLGEEGHQWHNGCWDRNPTEYPGAETRNGMSKIVTGLTVSQFITTTGKPWKAQKNLYRYIVARYGWSPNVAAWGTVAETEGVGSADDWWGTYPTGPRAWHNAVVKVIREDSSPTAVVAPPLDYRKRPISGWATHTAEYPQDNTYNIPYTRGERSAANDHGCFTAKAPAGGYTQATNVWAFDSYPWIYVKRSGVENPYRSITNAKSFPKWIVTLQPSATHT